MTFYEAVKGEARALGRQVNYFIDDHFIDELKIPRNGKPTGLIIPGYMAPRSAMRGLAEHVKKSGRRPKRWRHPFWKPLDENVEQIAEELDKQYGEVGGLSLFGHSLGGLILRDVLTLVPQVAKEVIFLGTPHYGTYIAYLNFFVPACKDMIPGSEYLKKLHNKGIPDNIPITNIVSRYDQAVQGWWRALLPDQDNVKNIIVTDMGHIGLTDIESFDRIDAVLL
jgi:hypothetical protein